jgi:pimeloyl-ACP methyl ester carboxylesterase
VTAETINGTTLAYDLVGDGPPLLLIHGSWGERETWGFILPGLSASFRVLSYDRRGHGESIGDPTAGTVHDDVADAGALIEKVQGEPAYVVANSYGSIVALRLATEHPELVRSMACHEPPALRMLEGTEHEGILEEQAPRIEEVRRLLESGDAQGAAEYFVDNVALGPGAWALIPPPMQDMFVRNGQTFLGELRDADALRIDRDALAQMRTPVLLTYGDQSPAWFAPIATEIASAAPTVRLQLLPGVGHVPHMTHPDDFVALAKSFLLI